MSNYPKKPTTPMDYMTPDCCKPPMPPACDCRPPQPPKPGCPGIPPYPYPAWGCIPPVPTVLEGSSLYEALQIQAQAVNQCIEQWNCISGECFAAMQKVVAAARMNDVYYSDCEVKYVKGYSDTEGCAYSLIIKKAVDSKNQPIRVKLGLAYNNTTNSGVTEDIFNKSYMESANVIITAVDPTQNKWYGPAMYQGAPIPGETMENSFVYGFDHHGNLKVFNADATDITLCQNGMVDVIGGCVPIIGDGEILSDAQQLVTKASITAIGYNAGTGDVFFFQCSAQDQTGMTGISVAKLFEGYGCTTAVITSAIPSDQQSYSNGMLYMGQMCENPQGGLVPNNLAYWFISKKPCFQNEFETTIANLVQTTGQNAWRNYLFGVEVEALSDRITQNAKDIAEEVQRAKDAEEVLQNNIDAEADRATNAEAGLQHDIEAEIDRATAAENTLRVDLTAEVNRATAEEARLDAKITAETSRAEAAEALLQTNINAEVTRATQAETELQNNINAEVTRATTRENEIQAALDKEIRDRISADNDLINAIEQEVLARKAADTAINTTIEQVTQQLTNQINNITTELGDTNSQITILKQTVETLQGTVDGITGGTTELPYLKLTGGTLTGDVAITNSKTLTLGRGPTNDMEAATKKYVDDAVATGGGSTGGDVSKEYVDQQISSLQEQITQNDTDIEGKVSKTGDTMSGPLDMGNNMITSLEAPVSDTDAANKKYVDDAVAAGGSTGDYLPLAGGEMTGPINFQQTQGEAAVKVDTDDALEISSGTEVRIKSASRAVVLSDGAANGAVLYGAAGINHWPPDASENADDIQITDENIKVLGPLLVVNQAGEVVGMIQAGKLVVGSSVFEPHQDAQGNEHLDIDAPGAAGSVYINRMNNGQSVPGGTGELWVTEIHAPNELKLTPGTNVNVSGKSIQNAYKIYAQSANNIIQFLLNTNGFAPVSVGALNVYGNTTTLHQINANANGFTFGGFKLQNIGAPENDTDAANMASVRNAMNNAYDNLPKVVNSVIKLTSTYQYISYPVVTGEKYFIKMTFMPTLENNQYNYPVMTQNTTVPGSGNDDKDVYVPLYYNATAPSIFARLRIGAVYSQSTKGFRIAGSSNFDDLYVIVEIFKNNTLS